MSAPTDPTLPESDAPPDPSPEQTPVRNQRPHIAAYLAQWKAMGSKAIEGPITGGVAKQKPLRCD